MTITALMKTGGLEEENQSKEVSVLSTRMVTPFWVAVPGSMFSNLVNSTRVGFTSEQLGLPGKTLGDTWVAPTLSGGKSRGESRTDRPPTVRAPPATMKNEATLPMKRCLLILSLLLPSTKKPTPARESVSPVASRSAGDQVHAAVHSLSSPARAMQ